MSTQNEKMKNNLLDIAEAIDKLFDQNFDEILINEYGEIVDYLLLTANAIDQKFVVAAAR
jgi:hypothetical protein